MKLIRKVIKKDNKKNLSIKEFKKRKLCKTNKNMKMKKKEILNPVKWTFKRKIKQLNKLTLKSTWYFVF